MGTSWYRRARYLVHVAVNDLCDTNSMALESHAFAAARDLRLPVVGTGGSSLGTAMAMGCLLVGSSGGSVATTNKVSGRFLVRKGEVARMVGFSKRLGRTATFFVGTTLAGCHVCLFDARLLWACFRLSPSVSFDTC